MLRETNAKDYTDEIIARIEHNLGPDAVRARSIVMERLLDDTPQGRWHELDRIDEIDHHRALLPLTPRMGEETLT